MFFYLDDIIVIGPDLETHLRWWEEGLERLKLAGLKLKPFKCELFWRKFCFLGHIMSDEGVATDPGEVSTVNRDPHCTSEGAPRDCGLLPSIRGGLCHFGTPLSPVNLQRYH